MDDKEKFYLKVIDNLSDGVYFVDRDRRITLWNKGAENITGYTADEIIGQCCNDDLLCHIDEEGRPLCIVGCPLFATMLDGDQRKAKVFLRHKNGYRVPIIVNIFPIRKEGELIGAVEIFSPCSVLAQDEDLVEKLSDIAMKDALTGLPNRRYLESFLIYKLNECKHFNKPFALLFVDVDDFTTFNNNYGHDVGDEILKNISRSVQKEFRKADLFGRWGGEEFIGICSIRKNEDATIIAEKVRILVENTRVSTPQGQLSATISVGVTVARPDDTLESIVARADQLMYESKRKGKNRTCCG